VPGETPAAAGISRAFVLAAGLGTRLRPLSLELPKPAWPLFDVPLAARVLRALGAAGVVRAVVNLHHLPEVLRRRLEPWLPAGMDVAWSPEPRILGTGGALLPWRGELGRGAFFLANADTYQEVDLRAVAEAHRERGAVATLTLWPAGAGEDAPIEVDGSGRIIRFLDARAPGSAPGRPCGFTGLHLLEPEVLDAVPGAPCCINADVHRRLVARGAPVYGHLLDPSAFWSDLGTPARYVGAHRKLLDRGRVPPAPGSVVAEDGVLPSGAVVRAPAYLGPGCEVGPGARVGPFAVIGAGARVAAGAEVSRAVVWGRAVTGSVRNAVVAPSGAVLPAAGG